MNKLPNTIEDFDSECYAVLLSGLELLRETPLVSRMKDILHDEKSEKAWEELERDTVDAESENWEKARPLSVNLWPTR